MADLTAEREAGVRAQRLLDDPDLKGAYEHVRGSIIGRWPQTKDQETREVLWREMQALESVWARLRDAVNTARMAEQQLSRGNTE